MAAWRKLLWLGVGWLTGLLTAAVLAAGAAADVAQRGLTVPVALDGVAARVQGEVQAAVLAQLPGAVSALQAQVPPLVLGELKHRLAAGSFSIGRLPLALPPEALGPEFDAAVQATVQSALQQLAIADVATDAARGVGERAAGLVRLRLAAELQNWQVTVHPLRFLSVPVILQPH